MIRHSSAEAFHDDDRRAMALRQRERIAALLLERGPMTGQMIAAATGMVPGTCRRGSWSCATSMA